MPPRSRGPIGAVECMRFIEQDRAAEADRLQPRDKLQVGDRRRKAVAQLGGTNSPSRSLARRSTAAEALNSPRSRSRSDSFRSASAYAMAAASSAVRCPYHQRTVTTRADASSTPDASAAARAGRRRTQRTARSTGPDGTGLDGLAPLETAQVLRQSLRRWRSGWCGSLCRHFRQMVSRSRGTRGLSRAGRHRLVGQHLLQRRRRRLGPERRPAREHSYRIAPRAYTSVAGPMRALSPRACSGAM